MSSAPTDCRVPDPTDAKADGGFGNHRAGYSPDRLAQAEYWARKGGTLAAGEGLVLVQEIDRLRKALDAARFFAAGWRREAYILSQCWTESIEDVNEVMDNLPYYYHQHLYGVDPALLNTKRKKPHA